MTILSRRLLLAAALSAAPLSALAAAATDPAPMPDIPYPTPRAPRPMKIGVIGSGRVGATLGELWLRAGHQVMFSDRDPAVVKALTDRLAGAQGGASLEAIAFGDVVLLTVPYGAMPDIARDLGPALAGKIVIDTGNPSVARDGPMAATALAKGAGKATAEFLPGARIARAFNVINYQQMRLQAHRPTQRVGSMIAADDPAARQAAVRLVIDAGFEPVIVGDLASAGRFELGTPVAGVKTAAEIKTILGL